MKRVLAFVLTAVLLFSTLSGFAFAANISILVNPNVFIGGDVYNIVWVTNEEGIGYVEYTYNGISYRVYDEENGIVRTDDSFHTVAVPKEHLDGAGSYTVYSTLVNSRKGYTASLGNTVSVKRNFQGYHGQSEINAWTVTDTHGINPSKVKEALANLPNQNPDILFLLGDLITFCTYKQVSSNSSSADYWNHSLCYIVRLAESIVGGTRPVVYTRGNHETRMSYSTYIQKYFGGDEGELYFDFTYGPISSIVLDYGEDKTDTHHEYTGFAHYEDYHKVQGEWLAKLGGYPNAENSTYKIALCHGYDIDTHYAVDLLSMLADYGTDMSYAGHNHTYELVVPKGYALAAKTVDESLKTDRGVNQYTETNSHTNKFPQLINGSHYENSSGKVHMFASQYTFKNGQIKTYVATSEKKYTTSFTVNAGLNTPVVNTDPIVKQAAPTYKQPDYYKENDDETDDTSFAHITKPVVFDTGDDNYTVVWASTTGKTATGQVRVHVDGTVYKFADTSCGYSNFISNKLENVGSSRSFTNEKYIHSAIVPKEYLEKGKYECVTQHIAKPGFTTNVELGSEISTGLIDFDGYDYGEDVSMMVVSEWENADTMVSKLRQSAKTADVIVMNGNIAQSMQDAKDLLNVIYGMGMLTSGKKPVYFVRGAAEIEGEYAPYLMKIMKYKGDQFYTKVNFGPVTSLILDTAAAYGDSFVGYNNLVQFKPLIKKQLGWLENQTYGDSEYNLVFSAMPELFNYHGTDFNKTLNKLGADLAVFGNARTSYFNARGTRGQNYATIGNGALGGDDTIATVLTFADGNITAKAIKDGGSTLLDNTISADDNAAMAYSDVEEDAWYANAVNYASNQTLMVGVAKDTFAPEQSVTRAQAAVVLATVANADLENVKETPFTDVAENSYYEKAVAWCYENEVTFGTSETTFLPEDPLTREQMCALIANMFPEKYKTVNESDFADFDAVADYAKTAVASLAKEGVVVGVGNGKFCPKLAVTRAELAQILYAAQI